MNQKIYFILAILLLTQNINAKLSPDFLKFESEQTDYDMYVLSIQWGPTECYADSDQCHEKLKLIEKNTFTMHGLWPSLQNGERMKKCNEGTQIQVQEDGSSLFQTMEKHWLSYISDNGKFWNHEYNQHGYCYSLKTQQTDPKIFFQYSMNVFTKYNFDQLMLKSLGNLSGTQQFEHDDLKEHFAGVLGNLHFDLSCKFYNSQQYLQEVRLYFDLNLNPLPSTLHSNDCHKDRGINIDFFGN